MEIEEYFKQIETEVQKAYDLANKAKQNSYDPDTKVSIPTANNIFERVEGLIGSLKPELIGSGLARRIQELDKKYGSGDWRVGLKIAEEVARGGFCSFADDREAIELGVRVGLAYLTMGVVAAPLEGFIEFKIKDRNDGGKYGSVCFAGPIRAAGGTAAAVTLLLADYLRRKFDLQAFDITENEIARNISECESYHERVARLQYYPSNEELNFLLKNLPVEINGDPTSEREVMIHKDLPRIGTSRIRGGMCLVLCEGLAQKSPKLLKKVEKWGDEFELSEWAFLKEYIEIKTRVHSKTAKTDSGESSEKIKPNTVFIEEIVAGRPIFAYPMTKGGFRCRYGRSPFTGLAAAGIHPATMHISGDFIATGAQLRLERPSKACAATPCSTIKGPVVKLMDESVVELDTEDSAIKHKNSIKEILFLGDILIPYGEFARSHHILVPSPYVAEWWRQDLKKAAPDIKFNNPLNEQDIVAFSEKYKIPLHPSITYFYRNINPQELLELMEALIHSEIQDNSILIPHNKSVKKILEDLYLPHKLIDRGIFIESGPGTGLLYALGYLPGKNWKIEEACGLAEEKKEVLEIINKISSVEIKDVAGCYIGARLGRPEKAKMRKLKGRPQILFPVGNEGGRMRSLTEALNKGFVEAEWPVFICEKCGARSIYPKCEECGAATKEQRFCIKCKKETTEEIHCNTNTILHKKDKKLIRKLFDKALTKLDVIPPAMIKGVRGMFNKNKVPEPMEKGILRAIHNVYVNKDGTIRFDAIETPATHFRPSDIGTSVQKLLELGYLRDIHGNLLENENQILELFPQDVILPHCTEWEDSSAMDMIFNTCAFIDDELKKYYGVDSYYNIKSPSDMIGKLIISLAPHTSAGMVGRIIGFSRTQGFFAHPYFHSANRRNCDGDELAFMMLMDALLNFSRQFLPDRRGGRSMDAPLVLTTRLDPSEVDDEVYNMDIVGEYPLEFYHATEQWKSPHDVKITQVEHVLGTPAQYRGFLFTHDAPNINCGIRVSAYKTLTSVFDKVKKQMELAEKIRAVEKSDVAKIIIEKHFLKDIKGNLRRFSRQEFRCLACNSKFRRIPLIGRCANCSGKLVLTVAEGTVSKYLSPSLQLAKDYSLPAYLNQTLEILKRRVDSVFGKEPTKQKSLGDFA